MERCSMTAQVGRRRCPFEPVSRPPALLPPVPVDPPVRPGGPPLGFEPPGCSPDATPPVLPPVPPPMPAAPTSLRLRPPPALSLPPVPLLPAAERLPPPDVPPP